MDSEPNEGSRPAGSDTDAELRDSLLVAIGPGADDLELIHAGKRLAEGLHAAWMVVEVRTSTFRVAPDRDRDRSLKILALAASLGAETVTLHGSSDARAIASYARLRQVTKILVRSPVAFGLRWLRHSSHVTTLKRLAPGIDVIAIAPRSRAVVEPTAPAETNVSRRLLRSFRSRGRDYLLGLAATAACTALSLPIAGRVDLINVVMIYLLGAAVAGLLLGRGPSALTSVSNILAFDFFFVPPRFSLLVLDTSYLVTFAVMLLVALIIANLMIAVREQTEAAGARERHTAALYAITRDLAIAHDVSAMVATAVRHIGEVLQAHARVLLCDDSGGISVPTPEAPDESRLSVDATAAQWVVHKSERAGFGTREFPALHGRYLPLRGSRATIGVLIVELAAGPDTLVPDQQRLLDAIADQLALALERAHLAETLHAAHLAAERAALRNTLLASISHDLRTPLSAIAGAGSMMAQNDFALDLYRRVTLGRLIEDKARDMSDLLSNVLELVRLESGTDVLNKEWHSLGELVDLAITRQESRLTGREVITRLPSTLPPVLVDASLIVQLLSNLLENAIKYTAPGTQIYLTAHHEGTVIRLAVEDTGPGLGTDEPERLFEKFARGRVEGNTGGVGLGLAICRAVARLHGGDIRAMAGKAGGARFEISFPYVPDRAAVEATTSMA